MPRSLIPILDTEDAEHTIDFMIQFISDICICLAQLSVGKGTSKFTLLTSVRGQSYLCSGGAKHLSTDDEKLRIHLSTEKLRITDSKATML
jgi:hypothetical protein